MTTLVALAFDIVAPVAFAQMGRPPGGPSGPGGMAPSNGRRNAPNPSQTSPSPQTETIRLLGLPAVQTELALNAVQHSALVSVARTLGNTVSEETAFGKVSKALTLAQTTRLRELLVQDMGYNAPGLSTVRSVLSLTSEQTAQISSILSLVESARRAAATASDPRAAQQALSGLASPSSAALAKVLTVEQDARLRTRAGRPSPPAKRCMQIRPSLCSRGMPLCPRADVSGTSRPRAGTIPG